MIDLGLLELIARLGISGDALIFIGALLTNLKSQRQINRQFSEAIQNANERIIIIETKTEIK